MKTQMIESNCLNPEQGLFIQLLIHMPLLDHTPIVSHLGKSVCELNINAALSMKITILKNLETRKF